MESHYFEMFIVSGMTVTRPYTPISLKYASDKAICERPNLLFLIKAYKVGTLSKYLSQKFSNETVAVSQPKGSLDLTSLRVHTRFAIMAAGSGITPMVSLIDHLLERNTPRTLVKGKKSRWPNLTFYQFQRNYRPFLFQQNRVRYLAPGKVRWA